MDQFFEIKEQNPGTILFFRMGDFYELFYEDAGASEVLGLSLTARDKKRKPIPMAGFPGTNYKPIEKYYGQVQVTVAEQKNLEKSKIARTVVTRIYLQVRSTKKI